MRFSFKPTRTASAAAWLIVVASLASCKDKEDSSGQVASSPSSSAGHAEPCPDGASDDPPKSQFRPAIAALKDKNYAQAAKLLRNLCEKHPNSATARVWLGDAMLYDPSRDYQGAAEAALVEYRRAEHLHESGCRLRETMHYYLRMGSAYAHLRKGRADEAEKQLLLAKERWPESAEVFYHLARARCLRGDFDGCLSNLDQAYLLARDRRRPLFLRVPRSLDDWFVRADSQSEFAALRRERPQAFQALKDKYRLKP